MKLYLIGGFLGSGKTTAILNACVELIRHKVNVGVITNDQGAQLVDTKFIKYANVSVKEVTDGCFCCNYNKLDELIENLKQKDNTEVIFAESVGSCTDMIATVVKPLQEFRTDIETIISVFVDVNVLPNILQGAALFVDSVNYIYKKQIQEADILVINKIDTLSNTELEKMEVLVASKYPEKTVLFQNSLNEASINEWLTTLTGTKVTSRKSLDIDYDVYGAGEAELAWLDLEIELFSDNNNAFGGATALVNAIHSAIIDDKLSVGHLKFFIDDGMQQAKISFTAGNQSALIIDRKDVSAKVDILVNARVQVAPERLEFIVLNTIKEMEKKNGYKVVQKGISSFRPGYPNPIHRVLT